MSVVITLTDEQIAKLTAWADEDGREGGVTAWGPKFSGAMEVAQQVRDAVKTLREVQHNIEVAEASRQTSGWGWPGLSRKAHYFHNNDISLCGKWMFTGERVGSMEKAGPDDCAECKRRVAKLLAKTQPADPELEAVAAVYSSDGKDAGR